MPSFTHALGVLGAGVLAFGAVLAASQLTAPLVGAEEPLSPAIAVPQEDPDDAEPGSGTQDLTADTGALPLAEAMVGRWRAPEPANQNAFLELTEYGLWFGSDGCNTAEGTWSVDETGALDTDDYGFMTAMGCDNEPLPETMWGATAAGITSDDTLVLTDADGGETVLERSRVDGVSLVGRWVGPSSDTSTTVVDFDEDGSWRATAGCSEFSGTWRLESLDQDERYFELPSDDVGTISYVSAPGALRIGPPPSEPDPVCTDADLQGELPFAYDTGYWLGFVSTGVFSLTLIETESLPDQRFNFYRTESPEWPFPG
jgi:heat shock protein HslJ